METIKKLNRSGTVVAVLLAAIFLLLLYCNALTPFQGDDYSYMYSFADGSRITRVADIVPSMAAHRHTTNGRVIPHFFVQLFLLLPLPVFKVLNAAMFTLYILLIYLFACRFPEGRSGHNAVLLCAIFGAVWILSPSFGSVFLWLDGSVNYLWGLVLFLLWLGVMAGDFLHDAVLRPWQELLFILLSFAVGNYSENIAVAAVFMMLLFIALSRFWKKRPWKRRHLCALCAMLIGFFLLAFAPAELVNKVSKSTLSGYVHMFLNLVVLYFRFWPLILFYIAAYWQAVRTKASLEVRVLSLLCVAGSLAQHFVLVFALYLDDRCLYLTCCLLVLACALLFRQLFAGGAVRVLCGLSAAVLVLTLYRCAAAVRDLRLVHYKVQYNEELIAEQLAEGKTRLQVPFILPETEYSCLYLWGYLRQDPQHVHNTRLAEYYGAEEITGYFLYEVNEP